MDHSLAVRRVEPSAVGFNSLLDVRDTLAAFRRSLPADADPGLMFRLDAQIIQMDSLHCSAVSDKCPFQGLVHRTEAYSPKVIVTAVQSCTLLRDSGDLEKQMRHAIRLLLPNQADELTKAIDRGLLQAPSASSVSRWRLAVDVAFMYIIRDLVSRASHDAVRCLLVDSSPQRGFDWLLTEFHTCAPSDAAAWCKVVWRLAETREKMLNLFAALRDPGQRHDVEDLHEQIKALESDRVLLSQQLEKFSSSAGQPGVDVHIAPPTAQGSRRAQLVHKVHGFLHTLRLEVGSWPAVANFLATVRAVTTDFGTEAGLAEVQDIDISALFPWTGDALDFDVVQAHEAHVAQASADAGDPTANPYLQVVDGRLVMPKLFPLSLQVPGALHILHHSVSELTEAFENYTDWFLPGVKAVTQVFSKHNRERFIAEVLRDSEASALETAVRELQLNLHKERWGSLITTCKEILSVRMVFTYWDPRHFAEGPPAPEASEADREAYTALGTMTDCVRNVVFWEYLKMLVRLSRVIDHLEHWFEACPCHYRKAAESSLTSNSIFRTRYACCMAGRRAPELAGGALDNIVRDAFATQHTELLLSCHGLEDRDKDKVLKDFAAGQAKLEQYFVVKFSHWTTLPHKLCVLGHHSEALARAGLQEAQDLFDKHKGSSQHHALTKHFFQGSVSHNMDEFLAGRITRFDSPQLLHEARACAFVSCVERSIEARHALLKAKTAVMKKINPATFSLAIRSHEFYRRCLSDGRMLAEWERQVQRLKVRPREGLPHVLLHLGFSNHPEILRLQHGNQKIKLRDAANVIYHCDLLTQYDKRADAARTLAQPNFRDNPLDAQKVRRLVQNESTEEGMKTVMLRVLMLEHFRKHVHEGGLYCLRGNLRPPRHLKEAFAGTVRDRQESANNPPPSAPDAAPDAPQVPPMFLQPDPDMATGFDAAEAASKHAGDGDADRCLFVRAPCRNAVVHLTCRA